MRQLVPHFVRRGTLELGRAARPIACGLFVQLSLAWFAAIRGETKSFLLNQRPSAPRPETIDRVDRELREFLSSIGESIIADVEEEWDATTFSGVTKTTCSYRWGDANAWAFERACGWPFEAFRYVELGYAKTSLSPSNRSELGTLPIPFTFGWRPEFHSPPLLPTKPCWRGLLEGTAIWALVIFAGGTIRRRFFALRRRRNGQCPRCGHRSDPLGVSRRCPECGCQLAPPNAPPPSIQI